MNTQFLHRSLLVVGLCVAATACRQDDTPATPANDVALATTSLGSVMTGENGKTLYFFANDTDGNSACAGGCLTNWPVFFKANLRLGDGLAAADFGTITRADGTQQTTYKGWPLYYYRNDAKAGDVLGENVGNVWFVAKPNYTIMIANGQLTGLDGKNYNAQYREGTGRTQYFTDGAGRTLYGFVRDRRGVNNFTRADFSNNGTWPIFEAQLGDIPSVLNRADFGTIRVHGTRNQLTYKGWPLYYFGSDNQQRGSTKGVSVPQPGVWPIINRDTPEAPTN